MLANKEELFNLCHSSTHNVIKWIFNILKHCFRILLLAPEYSLEIQAQIPVALAAMHNFIHSHNPNNDEPQTGGDDIIHDNSGDEAGPTIGPPEEVDKQQDQIV